MTHQVLHDRGIITLLSKLGLSHGEVKCYLALRTLGAATAAQIAKTAGLNRANAYDALKILVQEGLVEQEMTAGGARFHSAPLEQLQAFAHSFQKRATKLRWKIEDLIPQLAALSASQAEQPKILVYEGAKAIRGMIERSLSMPIGSEIIQICLFYGSDTAGHSQYSRERYVPERLQRKCSLRLLCPRTSFYESVAARDKEELRSTRFLSQSYTSADHLINIHIYGDEIALYWHAPEPKGVVIQSKMIANAMRVLFNIAWEVAERPKRKK